MNSFAFLFVCVQACLIQNVLSQCAGAYRAGIPYGPGIPGPALGPYAGPALAPGYAGPALAPGYAGPALGYGPVGYGPVGCGPDVAAYGGNGVGNVAVAGELPVGGTAMVGGQVPIIGAVEFGGTAGAFGTVSISGSCGCGCGGNVPYLY